MTVTDRFRPPETLVSLDDALDMLAERLAPAVPIETVATIQAERRVLAEEVVSPRDSPPFDNSAMDGFAFRFADLPAPGAAATLAVTARIAAGQGPGDTPGPGEAARIFTGAPLPPGLDTVVMQERCRVEGEGEGNRLHLPAGLVRGDFVRRRGEEFAIGATVLKAGRRLRPQDVAMAAAVGRASLAVYARLRVGVFSTGDEVVEPGLPLPDGAIYGSNRQATAALCAGMGCTVVDLGNIPDRLDQTVARLKEAAGCCDLLITTGGMSMGDEDHVRAAVERLGVLHLWRLSVKPGKPTAFGQVGDVPFVGLPGNPVSAMVTFMLIARPVILRLAGAVAEPMRPPRYPLRAAFHFDKDHARRQFLRAALRPGADGRPEAVLARSQQPNALSSLVDSDGLIDLAEGPRQVNPGDVVDFIPYESMLW